jgi:hypothetical protein
LSLIDRLKTAEENEKKASKELNQLFGKEFLSKMERYIYFHQNLDELSVSDKLFNVENKQLNIKPIFELKNEIINSQNLRHKNKSLIATYYFNDPNIPYKPLQLDITAQIKKIPTHLINIKYCGHSLRNLVDIELFEKTPIEFDSKNYRINDFLMEYTRNPDINLEDIAEIEPILALQELEKFHMKFLVFENDMYFPIYLGIGSNQPFNHLEKKNNHSRFYRYSMENESPFEQTSEIIYHRVEVPKNSLLSSDTTSDGNVYLFHKELGVLIYKNSEIKKALIKNNTKVLKVSDIFKNKKLDLIKYHVYQLFPKYENYTQVNFDPLEKINSTGHEKIINFLENNQLLGSGYQSKINVASDLNLHGYDNMYRLKIISLYLLRAIKINWMEDLIINTSKNITTHPITI